MTPLNGTKTHPLSDHAKEKLRDLIDEGPTPRQEFNPGVVNRLFREGLIEREERPSPYKKHNGALIEHIKITSAGRSAAFD